jgi:hypothetical protein
MEGTVTNYDRVSVVVGVILVGIVLLLVLEIPPRAFQFTPLGTPLTVRVTGGWLASLLLVGLSCAGTEAVLRTHPTVRRRLVRYTFPNWILPALTTLALALFLPQSPNLLYWVFGLAAGGGILAWLVLIGYRSLDGRDRSATSSQAALNLISYLLALAFFAAIYRTRLRSLVTATAVTVIASLIALSMLRNEKRPMGQIVLYTLVIGLLLGETTWALNYWRANTLTVGVLLMLLFYVLTGMVREYLRDSIDRRVVLEFLTVATLGTWIVFRFGPP